LAAAILLADRRASVGASGLPSLSLQLIRERTAPNAATRPRTARESLREDIVRRHSDASTVSPLIAAAIKAGGGTTDVTSATLAGQRTHAAGLPFLVNALARMGIAELLERQPDLDGCALPARVLLAVADRVVVPDDDPMRAALSPTLDEKAPPPRTIDAWVLAAGRWCRRHARLRLRDVVCRPGRLLATDTHLDVVLDPRAADIRVRRAGLDLDPGWVPWLGRVVTFHYSYE
jgi:hypothetical protein